MVKKLAENNNGGNINDVSNIYKNVNIKRGDPKAKCWFEYKCI